MPAGTIVAEGLTKVFHTAARGTGVAGALKGIVRPERVAKLAVDHVSLRVDQGELLALLGPNGAGKSTTIKMLCGILTPTGGRVEVNGITPHRDRIANARQVGAVFGQRSQLWRDLTARQSLEVDQVQRRGRTVLLTTHDRGRQARRARRPDRPRPPHVRRQDRRPA
jgi:ABC-2 type transport system ATP-binding protein